MNVNASYTIPITHNQFSHMLINVLAKFVILYFSNLRKKHIYKKVLSQFGNRLYKYAKERC